MELRRGKRLATNWDKPFADVKRPKKELEDAGEASSSNSILKTEPSAPPAPPARLCGIYLRDVLSLMDGRRLAESRQVSQGVKDLVETWPVGYPKPRRKHELLMIAVGVHHITTSGKFDRRGISVWKRRDWQTQSKKIIETAGCCVDELRDGSEQLVGELIYLNRPPDASISFSVMLQKLDDALDAPEGGVNRPKKPELFGYAGKNRLDETNAIHLLHLLIHLNGQAFEKMGIDVANPVDDDGLLNPKIFSTLEETTGRHFRLHCKKVVCINGRRSASLGPTTSGLATVAQLADYRSCWSHVTSANFDAALNFVLSPLVNCHRMGLALVLGNQYRANHRHADRILNFFAQSAGDLSRVIPHLTFTYPSSMRWPLWYPKVRALATEKEGETSYRFDQLNKKAKRHFQVTIKAMNQFHNQITFDFSR